MASSSKLTLDSVVRYCSGEGLSDTELKAELDELQVESDEEGLEARINDEEEDGPEPTSRGLQSSFS